MAKRGRQNLNLILRFKLKYEVQISDQSNRRHDLWHKDTIHNDVQRYSDNTASDTECCHAESLIVLIVMLSVL